MPTEEGEGTESFRLLVKATEKVESHASHLITAGTMTGILNVGLYAMSTTPYGAPYLQVPVVLRRGSCVKLERRLGSCVVPRHTPYSVDVLR